MHPFLVITLCILGGAAYGIGLFYLVSWLYTFCGRWIGGKGTYTEVKCAVGWSYYPFIVSGVIGLFSYYFIYVPWLQGFFGLASTIAFIWGLIILFKTVAEAHRFGAWRGVGTVVIALAIVFGVMMILSMLASLVMPNQSLMIEEHTEMMSTKL